MKTLYRLVLGSMLMVAPTWAGIETLTFDELPFVPVNNLTFRGITFRFQVGGVPSTDAHYHAFGPGQIVYVQDPSLEGDAAGTLTLEFQNPTRFLEFGVAMSTFGPPRVVTVELFNASSVSLGLYAIQTESIAAYLGVFPWTEGKFSWYGDAVKRAVINFDNRSRPGLRFALDNLSYDPTGDSFGFGPSNIPAPDGAVPTPWVKPSAGPR